MARIQATNTKPEMAVRRAAHALGYRFRLYRRDLPGCPDVVFPSRRKVILVHGCFWHRHHGCRFAYSPKSNVQFWTSKFARNVERDLVVISRLVDLGWAPLIVWECETGDSVELAARLTAFLEAPLKP